MNQCLSQYATTITDPGCAADARDLTCLFSQGFLVAQLIHRSARVNDVLFASTNATVDGHPVRWAFHHGCKHSYVFLVVSDNAHSVWNCALASVLAKASADRELYDEQIQAVTRDSVVQAVARVAVKIQIVFLINGFSRSRSAVCHQVAPSGRSRDWREMWRQEDRCTRRTSATATR